MLTVISVLSILMILSVIISLVPHDYWVFKVLEYPRLQKLTLFLLLVVAWCFFFPLQTSFHQVVFGLLVLGTCYLAYKIAPYTFLFPKELKKVAGPDKNNELRIFAANVLQENDQYQRMLQQIKDCDPDVIFLLETNRQWQNGLRQLMEAYPYQLTAPLENTYGLLFYSRFPLKESGVHFLVKNDIPSINAIVCLPSGKEVKIWGLHPEPPVPGENLYATAKDKELMQVALKVKEQEGPAIVFGDLNDVAWSHTTELFRKTSGLLDPRIGRGFYSTFSAHHWWVRFPLDYIFCSNHFGLISMKRLPPNGSDHFATFTHLLLNGSLQQEQKPAQADAADLQEAREIAQQDVKE